MYYQEYACPEPQAEAMQLARS